MLIPNAEYWKNRWQKKETGWDAGEITTPLKEYIDRLTDKHLHILIPGCGNAHEAAYLHKHGFTQVYLMDIVKQPLQDFHLRFPDFPKEHLLHTDFFSPGTHSFNLILEQTFFCAIHPSQRAEYAKQCHALLKENGKIVGVLFNDELNTEHPPYGGNAEEYKTYFTPYFHIQKMEPCYNSISPRAGRELFIQLEKK